MKIFKCEFYMEVFILLGKNVRINFVEINIKVL